MTITLLLRDRASGVIGVGTASRSLAVGNSVPVLDPRWGVAATQAWTNRELADTALAELGSGCGGDAAVDRAIQHDESRPFRQLGVLPCRGEPGVFTGVSCTAWAGHRCADDYIILGNFLAGADVLDAAEMVLQSGRPAPDSGRELAQRDPSGLLVYTPIPAAVAQLSLRLVDALHAAQGAGGDSRGQQSAALLVAQFGSSRRLAPTDVDLRVDDCAEPLIELSRLLELHLGQSIRSHAADRNREVSPPAG